MLNAVLKEFEHSYWFSDHSSLNSALAFSNLEIVDKKKSKFKITSQLDDASFKRRKHLFLL